MHSEYRIYLVDCADVCGLIHQMCRLKAKAGKLWNRALVLVSKKGECSKTIFQILVYYYYKLFYTGI